MLSKLQVWWFLAGGVLTGHPGERLRCLLLAQSHRTPLFLVNSITTARLNQFHLMLNGDLLKCWKVNKCDVHAGQLFCGLKYLLRENVFSSDSSGGKF